MIVNEMLTEKARQSKDGTRIAADQEAGVECIMGCMVARKGSEELSKSKAEGIRKTWSRVNAYSTGFYLKLCSEVHSSMSSFRFTFLKPFQTSPTYSTPDRSGFSQKPSVAPHGMENKISNPYPVFKICLLPIFLDLSLTCPWKRLNT